MAEARKPQETPQESSVLASLGLALSDWFERWFPDAFALALAAAAIVAAASMLAGSGPLETAQRFGAGFLRRVEDTFKVTAARMRVFSAFSSIFSPS